MNRPKLALSTALVQDNVPAAIPGVEQLFIGSIHAAFNIDVLKELGVTHILNASGLPPTFPRSFTYLSIDLRDKSFSHILGCIPAANIFIESGLPDGGQPAGDFSAASPGAARRRTRSGGGGGVLVHCAGGRSRSAAFCMAFLMSAQGLSFEEAMATCREARPLVQVNLGFQLQLRAYSTAGCDVHAAHQILLHKRLERFGERTHRLAAAAAETAKPAALATVSGPTTEGARGSSVAPAKDDVNSGGGGGSSTIAVGHSPDKRGDGEISDSSLEGGAMSARHRSSLGGSGGGGGGGGRGWSGGGQGRPGDHDDGSEPDGDGVEFVLSILDQPHSSKPSQRPRLRLSKPGSAAVQVIPPLRALERPISCRACACVAGSGVCAPGAGGPAAAAAAAAAAATTTVTAAVSPGAAAAAAVANNSSAPLFTYANVVRLDLAGLANGLDVRAWARAAARERARAAAEPFSSSTASTPPYSGLSARGGGGGGDDSGPISARGQTNQHAADAHRLNDFGSGGGGPLVPTTPGGSRLNGGGGGGWGFVSGGGGGRPGFSSDFPESPSRAASNSGFSGEKSEENSPSFREQCNGGEGGACGGSSGGGGGERGESGGAGDSDSGGEAKETDENSSRLFHGSGGGGGGAKDSGGSPRPRSPVPALSLQKRHFKAGSGGAKEQEEGGSEGRSGGGTASHREAGDCGGGTHGDHDEATDDSWGSARRQQRSARDEGERNPIHSSGGGGGGGGVIAFPLLAPLQPTHHDRVDRLSGAGREHVGSSSSRDDDRPGATRGGARKGRGAHEPHALLARASAVLDSNNGLPTVGPLSSSRSNGSSAWSGSPRSEPGSARGSRDHSLGCSPPPSSAHSPPGAGGGRARRSSSDVASDSEPLTPPPKGRVGGCAARVGEGEGGGGCQTTFRPQSAEKQRWLTRLEALEIRRSLGSSSSNSARLDEAKGSNGSEDGGSGIRTSSAGGGCNPLLDNSGERRLSPQLPLLSPSSLSPSCGSSLNPAKASVSAQAPQPLPQTNLRGVDRAAKVAADDEAAQRALHSQSSRAAPWLLKLPSWKEERGEPGSGTASSRRGSRGSLSPRDPLLSNAAAVVALQYASPLSDAGGGEEKKGTEGGLALVAAAVTPLREAGEGQEGGAESDDEVAAVVGGPGQESDVNGNSAAERKSEAKGGVGAKGEAEDGVVPAARPCDPEYEREEKVFFLEHLPWMDTANVANQHNGSLLLGGGSGSSSSSSSRNEGGGDLAADGVYGGVLSCPNCHTELGRWGWEMPGQRAESSASASRFPVPRFAVLRRRVFASALPSERPGGSRDSTPREGSASSATTTPRERSSSGSGGAGGRDSGCGSGEMISPRGGGEGGAPASSPPPQISCPPVGRRKKTFDEKAGD